MPPDPEARRDLLSAVALAVLAVAYLVGNRRYPLDSLAAPGPGVFPLAVGLLVLGLAGCQAASALRSRGAAPPPGTAAVPNQGSPETLLGGVVAAHPVTASNRPDLARVRVLAMTGLLVAFAAAAGVVGFLTASFVLALAASRLLGTPGWRRPIALALGVAAGAYAIFVLWLGVPLPAGLLR